MRNIKGIIIDKDGTLFDYAEVWGPLVSRSINEGLLRLNVPSTKIDKVSYQFETIFGVDRYKKSHKHGIIFRNDLMAWNILRLVLISIANGISPFKVKKAIMESIKHISDNIEKDIEDISFPGISGLIGEMKDEGLRIGLVTSDRMPSTLIFLKKMGIDGKFDFICTSDCGIRKKPNPDAIYRFMEEFGLENGEIAMVGDSKIDMDFAKRAKIGYTVAVLTGSGDRKLLERRADKVYPTILDIKSDPVIFKKNAR